jgi:hypothetical protein
MPVERQETVETRGCVVSKSLLALPIMLGALVPSAVVIVASAGSAQAQTEAVIGAEYGAVCAVTAILTGQALVVPACLVGAETLNQTFSQLPG